MIVTQVNQEDLMELLGKAVTCAVLGKSGPQRSRVLGLLYKVSHTDEPLSRSTAILSTRLTARSMAPSLAPSFPHLSIRFYTSTALPFLSPISPVIFKSVQTPTCEFMWHLMFTSFLYFFSGRAH
jgi:hypothetical protein